MIHRFIETHTIICEKKKKGNKLNCGLYGIEYDSPIYGYAASKSMDSDLTNHQINNVDVLHVNNTEMGRVNNTERGKIHNVEMGNGLFVVRFEHSKSCEVSTEGRTKNIRCG